MAAAMTLRGAEQFRVRAPLAKGAAFDPQARRSRISRGISARTTLFATLVARIAEINEGECERIVADIGRDEAARIPQAMVGRLLGQAEVRELMQPGTGGILRFGRLRLLSAFRKR